MERLIYYVLQTTRGWNSLILDSRLIGWYFNNKRHACPLPLHWAFSFFPESQWGWWLTSLSPYCLHASGLPSLSFVEDSASEYSVLLMVMDQGLWRVTPEIFYSLLLTLGKLGKYWEFGRKYKILSYLVLSEPSIRQAWKELNSAHYERLSTPHLTTPSLLYPVSEMADS